MKNSILRLTALLLSAALAASTLAQSSDTYPSRPVHILVPYAPGGATDIIARYVSTKLSEAWGQSVLVENRPGASGNIALEAAAKATPDGYTLFVGNVTTNAINENTFAQTLRTKPSRDLIGITNLIDIPHIVAAYPGFPPSTIAQLIEYAKSQPGKINYGSAGIGSYPHLDMLRLMQAAGIDMTHVPYKSGAAGMVPALISGEVQVMFVNLASTMEHVRAGRIKALATTMPNRVPELPNVPTMAEVGYPGIGTNAWNGMFAPAATPKPIVDKIYTTTVQLMSKPELKELLGKQMMTVSLSKSPQEYTEFIQAETQKWAEVIRDNKVKIE